MQLVFVFDGSIPHENEASLSLKLSLAASQVPGAGSLNTIGRAAILKTAAFYHYV